MPGADDFGAEVARERERLLGVADQAVRWARQKGATACEFDVGAGHGLSVTSRHGEVENVEFNRDHGATITTYLGQRSGSASTTDLSGGAIQECIEAALQIASCTDEDDCSGLCDPDLQCTDFPDLGLLYPIVTDPDEAVRRAVELDRLALGGLGPGLKDSDGASFDSHLSCTVLANSQGFCSAISSAINFSDVTLLGEEGGRMQRGSGYSVARDFNRLYSPQRVVDEAVRRTLGKLGARKIKTGEYAVIFTEGAARSLWEILRRAISGGAVYRGLTFLAGALGTPILPGWVTVREDPLVAGGLASACHDRDGVRTRPMELVKSGVLQHYLLSSYSSRKLKMVSNGHAGGRYNCFVTADAAHTRSLEGLMAEAGEGIVVESLMGQGINLVSGNYSQGASGYYFKGGERQYAVQEITIASNLRDMFRDLALLGDDTDERCSMQCGSVLLPRMSVSGT
ncbi:MAG: metalloprotease PmbA [Succinivibrionaceae bacterium]|nr:metalloprotease PmbA [Succinivibrionaceae bacterium]